MELQVVEGRPVLVATGASARSSADLLVRLEGLGVPEVVAVVGETFTTSWAPPLHARHVDWAAVAATLAAAHERGVTHGNLGPGSVLAGQVVAGWLGTGTPADDVAALGAMLPDPMLAQRALAADPSARPTMRAMTEMLVASPDGPSHRRRVVRPSSRGTAVAAAMVLVLLGLLAARQADPPASPPDLALPVLTADGVRWSAGQAGDVAAVADWDCDGDATPVLLRPGEGTVWGFPDWSPTSRPRIVAHFPEATGLRVSQAGGCDRVRPTRN